MARNAKLEQELQTIRSANDEDIMGRQIMAYAKGVEGGVSISNAHFGIMVELNWSGLDAADAVDTMLELIASGNMRLEGVMAVTVDEWSYSEAQQVMDAVRLSIETRVGTCTTHTEDVMDRTLVEPHIVLEILESAQEIGWITVSDACSVSYTPPTIEKE